MFNNEDTSPIKLNIKEENIKPFISKIRFIIFIFLWLPFLIGSITAIYAILSDSNSRIEIQIIAAVIITILNILFIKFLFFKRKNINNVPKNIKRIIIWITWIIVLLGTIGEIRISIFEEKLLEGDAISVVGIIIALIISSILINFPFVYYLFLKNKVGKKKFKSEKQQDYNIKTDFNIGQFFNDVSSGKFGTNSKNSFNVDIELAYIDNLKNGYMFEEYTANLFKKLGYVNVKVTDSSGDYGVDVLAEKNNIKYAIQCKLYSNDVGVESVKEVYAGKDYYNCDQAIVLTNSKFTRQSKEWAVKINVLLWDRTVLRKIIKDSQRRQTNDNTKSTESVLGNFNFDDIFSEFAENTKTLQFPNNIFNEKKKQTKNNQQKSWNNIFNKKEEDKKQNWNELYKHRHVVNHNAWLEIKNDKCKITACNGWLMYGGKIREFADVTNAWIALDEMKCYEDNGNVIEDKS